MGREKKHAAGSDGQDGLGALLETERELTGVLEHAREEAARILDAAAVQVAAMEAEFEARLAQDVVLLEEAEERATVAKVGAAATMARERAARLDAVPDGRVDELSDAVLADFLGLAPMSAAP